MGGGVQDGGTRSKSKQFRGANPEFDSTGVQNGANQEANRCTSKFDHLASL